MHRLIPALAAVLLLSGCAGTPTGQVSRNGESNRTPSATSEFPCLEVSPGALGGLQTLAKDNVTFLRAAAVTDDPDGPWYVAAEFEVDYGFDDVETATATWITQQDPTTAEDAAYLAVDALAAEVTDYVRQPGGSAADRGAELAQECLD